MRRAALDVGSYFKLSRTVERPSFLILPAVVVVPSLSGARPKVLGARGCLRRHRAGS